jgi:hypothetical protein
MQLPGDVVVGRHIDAEALEIGVGSLPPAVELVEADAKRPLLEFMGDADVVARGEALLQKIAEIVGYKTEMNVSLYPTDLYHRTLPFAHVCVYIMHDTVHAHLPCPPPLGNGRMRQINKMPIN